jgi:hypothetical protein
MGLNLNVTELRTFNPQGGGAKTSEKLTSEDARKLLVGIRSQLVGKDGTIESGYLRIHNNKQVEGVTGDVLVTQGRFSGEQLDKAAATRFVKDLVHKAYGETLSEDDHLDLTKFVNLYLKKSGARFGTHSFVKLINALETRDGGFATGKVKKDTRLVLPNLGKPIRIEIKKPLPVAECGAPAAAQFAQLNRMLSPEAKEFFQHLFKPLQPGSTEQVSGAGAVGSIKPTYVLGDADGSVCRTALAAMNCGMMKLDNAGLETLAKVLEAETSVLYTEDGLKKFQQNKEISDQITSLVNNATFSQGESQLVSIGDIIHDRFSNNKEAMGTLIEKLHEQGAVFITGNHDVYDEVNPIGNLQIDDIEYLKDARGLTDEQIATMPEADLANHKAQMEMEFGRFKEQNGFYGAKQLTKAASDDLVAKCFVNAYFDKENATLYTHNGVTLSPHSVEGFETYSTGLGEITPAQPGVESLAEAMNRTIYDRNVGNFTNFRPQDGEMQSDLLGPISKWEGRNVRFVHGHEAKHGVTGNVINVNARSTDGFSPVLMVIE